MGDFLLCAWPFQWGLIGAALGTVLAHFLGCFMMLSVLFRCNTVSLLSNYPTLGQPHVECRAINEKGEKRRTVPTITIT
eukprot:4729353-Amphidinium_carterae.1